MFDRVVSTHLVVALNFLDYSVPGLFQRQYVHFELIDILSFVMWLRKELRLSFYWTPVLWRVLWNHCCLFVCQSVSVEHFFSGIGHYFFSDFLCDGKWLNIYKLTETLFQKKSFLPKSGQKGLKMAPK